MSGLNKILVANRGEIALRVVQAIKEMGRRSVVIYSQADQDSLAVQHADESYALKGEEVGETYLDQEQILGIAKACGAKAVHPGYGFLSENAAFAEACEQAGLIFIGPKPETIRQLGDKITSKRLAEAAKVPVIPGHQGEVPQGKDLDKLARKIGFPLMIKATAGGGGKGMRIVAEPKQLAESLDGAAREAAAYFGNAEVFIEKYLENPRHIEVQILGDTKGKVVALGERECSIQRRHQKMIEESPSPSIDDKVRKDLAAAAIRLAEKIGYVSAGTVEFIVDEQNRFYFLEVNTRLQVEHPVTEWVTGVDLVKNQILIAEGAGFNFDPDKLQIHGHAIECRLYAEDPENQFFPSEGRVGLLLEPKRPGVRIDSSLFEGQEILSLYDPMLAKLTVFGKNRQEAMDKMVALLRDYVLLGVRHNLDFLRFTLESKAFQSGHYHTHTVAQLMPEFLALRQDPPALALMAALLAPDRKQPSVSSVPRKSNSPWQSLKGYSNV